MHVRSPEKEKRLEKFTKATPQLT